MRRGALLARWHASDTAADLQRSPAARHALRREAFAPKTVSAAGKNAPAAVLKGRFEPLGVFA
jgi:hypothetical protein